MKTKTVMHVDDDKIIGKMVKLVLEKMAGWNVEYCSNCEQALEYMKKVEPDLVILDIMMPNADGPTTMKALRNHGLSEDVPVIMMSAKVLTEVSDFYNAMGVAGLIQKPFNPATLTDEIQLLVDRFETNRLRDRLESDTAYGAGRPGIREAVR
jgi:DNA-binding response OmpR family regulator